MSSFLPYKHINRLLENESFEPTVSWGLRMAVASIVPVIWGAATGNMVEASWITLTAECICWVELKGSFGQRIRVLAGGTFLAIIFAILGSVTGVNIWLTVLCMLVVGFLSSLFKNLGERGSALSVCVFVMFIISNAYPTASGDEIGERVLLTFIGGAWNFLVGMAVSIFIPAKEPYRRTIALIWKANASLLATIATGWDGKALRSSARNIYLKEKDLRTSIDNSFHFYEQMAHQTNRTDKQEHQLAQLRKATALVGTHIIAISEELENLRIKDVNPNLRLMMSAALLGLEHAISRMAVFVILLKPEEELLVTSRITRLKHQAALLKEYKLADDDPLKRPIKRITQLIERSIKLMESAMYQLEEMEDDRPVYRSYSLMKTLLILHPKHWWRNIRLLFDLNTFTARYALRSAVAAALAIFIYKWFNIDHGYWLPFTVIIVIQPYFGATLKKAIDRVIGTVAGGLAGGLIIRMHAGLYLQEIMLFVCFVMMVYFLRRKYAVAAFFITISLVLLFDVEEHVNPMLIVIRAAATIGGAVLGILAGFALLPNWDKKWLPIYLSNAIICNYHYYTASFFSSKPINWTRHKRSAESKNSNAFDSFNRYMDEPSIRKKHYALYYHIITHNVRITRELNNIHLELESLGSPPIGPPLPSQKERLIEGLHCLNKNMDIVKKINPDSKVVMTGEADYRYPYAFTAQQSLYLDKLLIEAKAMTVSLEQLHEITLSE